MTDPMPSGALALIALREQDAQVGVDPAAPSPVTEAGPPPAPPLHIRQIMEMDPPDWPAIQAAERAEAERERTRIAQQELERLAEHERPAPKRRWRAP